MDRRFTRDERGATAVLVAILALVLFSFAAFAVDLGHAYAKRAALQSAADQAVLAAAADLNSDGGCNPEVVATARDYLNDASNQVNGQPTVTDGDLTDGNDANGEITCANWRVELQAPDTTVDFALAPVMGVDDTTVPARAVVQIKSPASATLPMYAVSGCDYGQQQMTDPPPGHEGGSTPESIPDFTVGTSPINDNQHLDITSPDPAEVPSETTGSVGLTLSGQKLDDTSDDEHEVEVYFTNAAGDHYPGNATSTTAGSGNSFEATTNVPSQVLDLDGIWWVRIKDDSGWTKKEEAQPFTVGEMLFCDGMVSGNFGTLKVARSDSNQADWVALNIVKGLEPTLQVNASDAVPCSPEDSTHDPEPLTDCVGTDPGFPNLEATNGFIDGAGGEPGRLDHDTLPGCDRANGSSRTSTSPALNDDTLSCFLEDGHTIQDAVDGTAEHILSGDIFSSPRFFLIPVIPVQASSGSSTAYPIIGFRPGFITEEPLTSTNDSSTSVTDFNGIKLHSNDKVQQIDVVLFDDTALPEHAPVTGGEMDYTGSGTKVLVLVE